MNFDEAIRDGLSKYAKFDGRSSRSAYWWFVLFSILVYIATEIVDAVINTPVFTALAVIGLFLPSLARVRSCAAAAYRVQAKACQGRFLHQLYSAASSTGAGPAD